VLSNRALTLLDKEPRDPKLTLSLAWFENETKERRNSLQMHKNVCVCLLCVRDVEVKTKKSEESLRRAGELLDAALAVTGGDSFDAALLNRGLVRAHDKM